MSFIFFTSYSSKNRTKAFERFVKTLHPAIVGGGPVYR
jgi:hypothetical protein